MLYATYFRLFVRNFHSETSNSKLNYTVCTVYTVYTYVRANDVSTILFYSRTCLNCTFDRTSYHEVLFKREQGMPQNKQYREYHPFLFLLYLFFLIRHVLQFFSLFVGCNRCQNMTRKDPLKESHLQVVISLLGLRSLFRILSE